MRYYGSKTKLLNYIENVIVSLPIKNDAIIFDIFSGTTIVGQHFKKLGYRIYSNDFLKFSYALAHCYIKTNRKPRFIKIKPKCDPIQYFNKLKGKAGFITKNYSPYRKNRRQYLSVENAKKVDAVREQIENWKRAQQITQSEYYYLLTSLIEAINLVSNVAGTYAAYLKKWDARALKTIKFVHPVIINSKEKNKAFNEDANKIVGKHKVDVLYLDPPYNGRQFASNYFFLELIVEGWFDKKPNIYGKSGMRPYEHQKSDYSISKKASTALEDLILKAKANYIVLSYNNEGIIPHSDIKKILTKRGTVKEFSKNHKRYRAINQDGSNIKTKETLFLLTIK